MAKPKRTFALLLAEAALIGLVACTPAAPAQMQPTPAPTATPAAEPYLEAKIYAGNTMAIDAADFNLDHYKELAIAGTKIGDNNIIQVYMQDADKTELIAEVPLFGGSKRAMQLRAWDINNDTFPDILVAGDNIDNANTIDIYLLLNDSGTGFRPPRKIGSVTAYTGQVALAVADRNKDGISDLVVGGTKVGDDNIGVFYILYNKGDGNFSAEK